MPASTLIRLTDSTNKLTFYLDAANVRLVSRAENNPLETMVVTYHMTQQGLQAFRVVETAEEVARAVNAGRQGKDLLLS